MYTYMYIHVHACIYINYIYIYIHVHASVYEYIFICIHTCTYIYIYIHVHASVYENIHIYVYIHGHIYVFTYMYTQVCMNIYTYIYVYIYVHARLYPEQRWRIISVCIHTVFPYTLIWKMRVHTGTMQITIYVRSLCDLPYNNIYIHTCARETIPRATWTDNQCMHTHCVSICVCILGPCKSPYMPDYLVTYHILIGGFQYHVW